MSDERKAALCERMASVLRKCLEWGTIEINGKKLCVGDIQDVLADYDKEARG
jgi:hypothetical protein